MPICQPKQKQLLFTFLLIVSISITAKAQFKDFLKPDTIHWASGKITWNDFKGPDITKNEIVGEIYVNHQADYVHTFLRGDGVRLTTIMDRRQSWHKSELRNNNSLQYFQTIFNLMEYYRRKLLIKISAKKTNYLNGFNGIDLNAELQESKNEFDLVVSRFQKETLYGNNLEKAKIWSDSVTNYLHSLDNLKVAKAYRNFGAGMFFGFGFAPFAGNISKYVNPAYNFGFGFDFSYKKAFISLNGFLGGMKIKQSFTAKEFLWNESKTSTFALANVNAGYMILKNFDYSIIPYAGISAVEFTIRNSNDDDKKNDSRLVDASFQFGIEYNKFFTGKNKYNDYYFTSLGSSELKLNLSWNYFNFTSELSGHVFMLGICYGLYGRGCYNIYN